MAESDNRRAGRQSGAQRQMDLKTKIIHTIMKTHGCKWLGLSFLFLVILLSCKKKKGVLDDFPPGRFHFIYVLKNNTNYDTITGELTGPYVRSAYYMLEVRQELLMDKQLKSFNIGDYKKITRSRFSAQVNIGGTITYEDHTSDYLLVHFESGDTLFGSLTLTRKE